MTCILLRFVPRIGILQRGFAGCYNLIPPATYTEMHGEDGEGVWNDPCVVLLGVIC
jgi:hypothetical protein